MKILRNKTYQGMVDKEFKLRLENDKLIKIKETNESVINNLRNSMKEYEQIINNLKMDIKRSNYEMVNITKDYKKQLNGAKGGYVKEINKLKKQVEELTFKLEESMTDKYLVKKIKPGRTPKGPQMKLKDCSRISNISRKVFGKQC